MPTDSATTTTVLTDLQALVREQYVLERDIDAITDGLDSLGRLPDDPEALAGALTERLQAVNGDKHLRVRRHGDRAAPVLDPRPIAGGIRQVRRLDEATGLLELAPYLLAPHDVEPYLAAAFTLVGDVRHLVIDLRACRGGTPWTTALVCSYLLGGEPTHLEDLVSRHHAPQQSWTRPAAHRLAEDVRITVLTGSATFSGGEDLAYTLQAQGRAVVVGETTGGGAHPVAAFRLSEDLEVTIPVARSVSAVTGTNWEGVGVTPDIRCAGPEALDVALTLEE